MYGTTEVSLPVYLIVVYSLRIPTKKAAEARGSWAYYATITTMTTANEMKERRSAKRELRYFSTFNGYCIRPGLPISEIKIFSKQFNFCVSTLSAVSFQFSIPKYCCFEIWAKQSWSLSNNLLQLSYRSVSVSTCAYDLQPTTTEEVYKVLVVENPMRGK